MADKQKRRNTRENWPVAYRLMAMGAIVAYTAVGTQTVALAADLEASASASAQQSGTLPVRRFDIAPGPLETVIAAFRNATGLQIEVAKEALGTVQSPGISGVFTVEQALKQMLGGTNVTYRFTGANAVTLELADVKSTIDVTGQASPALPTYTAPLRDLPQTITVIPRNVIEEQAATTLRDVLRNVPGLTMTAGEGGVPAGDNMTLRGFSARNDIFVDGARDLGPQSRDPFNLEQVEVIKGPTSAYTGRGSTGGAINLVSKNPGLSPVYGLTSNFGTDGTRRVTTDLNTPLRFLGERTALRLNAVAHHSGVAGRDVVEGNRWGFAPSLSFGLGTPTRLTVSYYKLKQDNIPDYGIPWVTATQNVLSAYRDQPAPVDRENFYGLNSRDREVMNADLGTVRFEHDFSDSLTLRNQLRYGRSTRNSITTAPRFASNDTLVINRNGPSWGTEDNVWDNQTDIRANFSTGAIEHTVVTGMALTREANERIARTVAGAPTTTLYDPNPDQLFNGTIVTNPIVGDLTANSQSLYAFDTVQLHEKFQLNGGLRFDRFDVDGINTSNVNVVRVDKMTNFRAGAVYKPVQRGSVYFSYGTSMSPSLEGLSYQPADTTLEPEKTVTYEAGTKWDAFSDRVLFNAAVFRVEKTNARTPGATPDDPPIVLDGKQRVNGIELGVSGSITRSLRVFGGYTLLASKIVDTNTAAERGKQMINTPKNSFNLWATYSKRKFQLGLGARFVDSRFGNLINSRRVGSYWTADAMAGYQVHPKLDLRLNLYNMNDAYYFDRLGGGHLIPGAARSAMVSTNFRF